MNEPGSTEGTSGAGKTVEQYIMVLYNLAEHCNYKDMKEEMIRNRLIIGIQDSALSEKLQLDAKVIEC